MKYLILLFFLCTATATTAQDSTYKDIAAARLRLKTAFQNDDHAEAGLWMDSLARMGNEFRVALSWDERWLLYYWTESFGNLFEEVSGFDDTRRAVEAWKRQPAKDSLFEVIDKYLYEERFRYFNSIQRAFLSGEEKAFAVLQLEYLLRLNAGDETEFANKIDTFIAKFPSSRYNNYLRSIRPSIYKTLNKGWTLSAGLINGSLRGELEQNFDQAWGLDLIMGYWQDRWSFLADVAYLGSGVKRDLYRGDVFWPKNESVTVVSVEAALGYDVVNSKKLRLFPTLGINFRSWGPSTPSDEDEDNPTYYDKFRSRSFNGVYALNADLKMKRQENSNYETGKGSYHGFRLRVGYQQRLIYSPSWDVMQGNLFFFALHYNYFGYNVAKK
jgi:hypothetical protein